MTRYPTGLLIAVVCGAALAADEAPPPREAVDVAAIVRQLGSEDFAEREAATKRLSTLSVDVVPPELLAALKSDNPEIRQRAAKAVKALRGHIALLPLPRAERFARRGQIDLFVASTAGDYKADDPRVWEPAMELGRAAVEQVHKLRGAELSSSPATFPSLAWYKKDASPTFTRADEAYENQKVWTRAIQAPAVRSASFIYSLVVSRGPVNLKRGSQGSLFLATGSFECGDLFSRSVVICDGDVRVKRHVSYSLIVARGDISVEDYADASALIAGGKVTIGTPPKPVSPVPVADPEKESRRKSEWCQRVIIEEKVTKPLGFITFFELSAVGVEVKEADKTVRVTMVADDRPFAAAGVRVGDVITAVNGKKPESAESLRRLLRDALALGDAAVVVRRGDATATLKVSLLE